MVPAGTDALRAESLAYLARAPLAHRKRFGQYFTPRSVRARLLDRLTLRPGLRVLDPGCGTGEFLTDVRERCPRAIVSGFDVDPALVASCRARGLDVERRDFLADPPDATFDLVIGNPPYFELRASDPRVERWRSIVSGRPNAYGLFFAAALDALVPGGRLAFVVAPSMNNGAYFAALRRHLLERAAIESLEVLDEPDLFHAAQQSVMLIVLLKGARSEQHVFRVPGRTEVPIFAERPDELASLVNGAHTLADLECTVRTGRCVWNQRRDALRRAPSKGTVPLIWAHNIGDGALAWTPDHKKRPQHVRWAEPDVGPAIVVNRVTGKVGAGRLRAAMVPRGMRFVAENHVNVVQGPSRLPWRALLEGLTGARAARAVQLLTGNTQISATELLHLVPVAPAL